MKSQVILQFIRDVSLPLFKKYIRCPESDDIKIFNLIFWILAYSNNKRFILFKNRLKTFKNFEEEEAESLAKKGLYYDECYKKLKCFFCGKSFDFVSHEKQHIMLSEVCLFNFMFIGEKEFYSFVSNKVNLTRTVNFYSLNTFFQTFKGLNNKNPDKEYLLDFFYSTLFIRNTRVSPSDITMNNENCKNIITELGESRLILVVNSLKKFIITIGTEQKAKEIDEIIFANTEYHNPNPEEYKETEFCFCCKKNEKNCVLLPCSHLIICNVCSVNYTVCPYPECNTKISVIMKVFIV